jgi:hypothetical protein
MTWWAWLVACVSTLLAVLGAAVVLLYRRESRRVAKLNEADDDVKDELLDDYRGRAVKRIQQINQLRKSPSKIRVALASLIQKHLQTRRIMQDGNAQPGDGMRSLYTQPDGPRVANQPLVRTKSSDELQLGATATATVSVLRTRERGV